MFSKSVENGHFSQNSKGGTKGKFSKMADFLWIESLTILDLYYAKNRMKKHQLEEK